MVKSKRRAFTLIELLVVISIIALLLSILMPGLQKAKQHALRMLCRTNLHSYGIAMAMYLNEYDDEFPDAWMSIFDSCQGQGGHDKNKCDGSHQNFQWEGSNWLGRTCRWHDIRASLEANPEYEGPLYEFLQAEDINLCPVFAKVGKSRFRDHFGHETGGVETYDPIFGYSQNAFLGRNITFDYDPGVVLKSSGVKSPARTFVFAEENMWTIPDISTAVLNDTALLVRTNPTIAGEAVDAFATFHSAKDAEMNEGTGNAVMMDGSIEAVQPYNDGTFRKAWPKLGGVFKKDDRP
ncbi:MAG: type II secretion system protein [Planctomycetota bacterium]|jgi:prepilin-type N-terminal cleavage/methylation domain-containing protein